MKNKQFDLRYCDNMILMNQFPNNYFDLAIVDPPYGIGESSNNNKSRLKLSVSKDYGNDNWDDSPESQLFFLELKRVSKNQIIFGANHFIQNIKDANSSCWIVWNKENGNNDFADCELAWTSFLTAVRMVSIRWHGMLQHDMKDKEIRIHPTQKPVKLYEWILKSYAKHSFKILDTHLGSAPIALAVDKINKFDQLNLHLTACENNKHHYMNALKRIEYLTIQNSMFSE